MVFKKGENHWKGRKHTKESKEKMSKAKLGKPSWNKVITGKNSHALKTGKTMDRGYIYLYMPKHPFSNKKGLVAEHRFIVEKKIGRYLTNKEEVHHLDFNRSNNDIENLMLFSSKSKHISFHNKIRQFGITNSIKKQIKDRWNKSK